MHVVIAMLKVAAMNDLLVGSEAGLNYALEVTLICTNTRYMYY